MAAEPCSTATSRDLEQLEHKIDIRLAAAREQQDLYNELTRAALEKAEVTLVARFEQVNNLRAQVTEERGNYVRREAYDALAERLARVAEATETRIGGMEKMLAAIDGSKWAFGVVVTLIALAISAGGLFLRHP